MYRLYDYLPSGNGYKVRLVLRQLGLDRRQVVALPEQRDRLARELDVAPDLLLRLALRAPDPLHLRQEQRGACPHRQTDPGRDE